jgi:hypothetical protein
MNPNESEDATFAPMENTYIGGVPPVDDSSSDDILGGDFAVPNGPSLKRLD